MVDIGGSHRLLRHSKMKSERALRLIESGKVPFRGGVCLDCYNQAYHIGVHITITARYDDGNKFVTQVCETK